MKNLFPCISKLLSESYHTFDADVMNSALDDKWPTIVYFL